MHAAHALLAGHPYLLACLLWSVCWSLWILGARDDERPIVVGGVLALVSAGAIALLWIRDAPSAPIDREWIYAVDVVHGVGALIGVAALLVRRRQSRRARPVAPPVAFARGVISSTASRRRRRRSSAR